MNIPVTPLIVLVLFLSQGAWAADKSSPVRSGTLSVYAGGLSGQGYRDGARAEARFSFPNGMAFDRSGNLFVADSANSLIRKIAPNGVVSTVAGTMRIGGSADGPASTAQFNSPADVAVDTRTFVV